jgi:membrane fusion protein, multidrug efflux system
MTGGGTMVVSRVQKLIVLLIAFALPACNADESEPQSDAPKFTLAVVQSRSTTIKQSYPCRIESHRRAEVCTEAGGRLAAILVKEGQAVRYGDLLFQVGPPTDKKKREAENREKVVSITAPCDGLVGALPQRGSIVNKGEILTTVSDNSMISVYFGVPEKHYLEFMASTPERRKAWETLELVLADHTKLPQAGKFVEVVGGSNQTADIPFQAVFPNPDGLLRDGQTGTLSVNVSKVDIFIPKRATFEDHASRYIYVVDKEHVAHRCRIVIQDEAGDLFVVKHGVGEDAQIVVDGVGEVRDGDRVE